MTANFNTLGKKLGLNEETQTLIQEEWNKNLSEAREEIAAELREEFAQKFSHDKELMIESVDKFLTEQVAVVMEDFAADRKKLVAERVAYKTHIKQHTAKLNEFLMNQLAKEIKEHRKERVDFVESLGTLETFLLTQLAEEIKEFHSDKKALVEQKVKLTKEAAKHIAEAKTKFVSRAAQVIEESMNKTLRKEISQFKEDIDAARKNDFGRRVFEAFVGEYSTTYLNENSEVKKLRKMLESKDQEIQKTQNKLISEMKEISKLQSKLSSVTDLRQRDATMRRLLAPLGKEKASVMADLLESTQTKDLEKAYNKYLPALLEEKKQVINSRGKKSLTESNDVKIQKTGDRVSNMTHNQRAEEDASLVEIRRLAGL